MSKRIKQIIATILSITLMVGCINIDGFINTVIINAGEEGVEVESPVDEENSKEPESAVKEEASTEPESATEQKTSKTEVETETETETETEPETITESTVENEPAIPSTNTYAVGGAADIEILEDGGTLTSSNNNIQLSKTSQVVKGGEYHIKSTTDWEIFAALSKRSSLEGMTFTYYYRENKYDWTLTNLTIGCETYPFAGIFKNYWSDCVINTNVVLFDYLSYKAQIGLKFPKDHSININYTSYVHAGIANHYVLDKGCTAYLGDRINSNFFVKVTGRIYKYGQNDIVGGMFSKITVNPNSPVPENGNERCTLYLDGKENIALSEMTNYLMGGEAAGGLAGMIEGKIDMYIKSIPITKVDIYAYASNKVNAAGGLVGIAKSGVRFIFENTEPIVLDSNVYYWGDGKGYYSGGMIGYMEDCELDCSTDAGIIQQSNVSAYQFAGGLIGYAKNCKIKVKNYVQGKNTYIYQVQTGSDSANFSVGGVIGRYYCDDDYIIANGYGLELSHIKSENKNADVDCNNNLSSADNSYNKRGGLVGSLYGGLNRVYIHDINTDAVDSGEGGDNCFYVNLIFYTNNENNIRAYTDTGYLVGALSGADIKIENVKFNFKYIASDGRNSNSMGGTNVGDIAAYVGRLDGQYRNTKIVVKDIEVMNSYVRYAKSYHGGLFGVVYNSAIALQGNVDLRKVPYKTYANDAIEAYEPALLASLEKRGFIAGYARGSLVYADTGCNYQRPITYNDDGTIAEFDAGIIQYTNYNSQNTGSTYKYCIDDIGNAGSVYKNVGSVLNIENDYGSIVTGTVEKDTDGYYVIDSLEDALRLSVAGSSVSDSGYPQFGGKCFPDADNKVPLLSVIFSSKYRIHCDLNLKDAGIHGFSRNDTLSYPFTGTFEGVKNAGKNPVITLDFISHQNYGGMFANAKNATFKNLDITGYLHYLGKANNTNNYDEKAAAGSLAAHASGNITIDNVNIYTSIKEGVYNYTTWDNSFMYFYGGMFGEYYPGVKDATYTCTNSIIEPVFTTVRANAFAGGMIGWVRVGNNSTVKNMDINGCTISTKIIGDRLFTQYSENNTHHARIAGFITLISSDYRDVGTTNNTGYLASSINNATYATINMTNNIIDDVNIDLTNASGTNIRTVGGTLGYSWAYVDVTIDTLRIINSNLKSKGIVGGLLSFISGGLYLKNIRFESFNMQNLIGNPSYCGMLVGNGQYAFTTLENDSYYIDTNGNVTVTGFNAFDEVVGVSLKIRHDNGLEYPYSFNEHIDASYSTGGIVNIIDSRFSSFTNTDGYRSYINRLVDKQNKYTRYYYNLFTGDAADWTITDGNIENEKQFMTFIVSRYVRNECARFVTKYSGTARNSYSIKADMDLKGYSYYPAPINGVTLNFNNHTVKFHADTIKNLENALYSNGISNVNRNNESVDSQHYMMHAGLLCSTSGNNTIRNLTLEGTVANLGDKSGAIASIYSVGNLTIDKVTFNNLKINNYASGAAGLMLSRFGYNIFEANTNSILTVKNITTTGYDNTAPVASSLIAYVGNDDSTKISTNFESMMVEDEKITPSTSPSDGKVFKYASYVYNYRFTTNLAFNSCYMSYKFTKAECDAGNVTFGDEIKVGVDYADTNKTAGDSLSQAIEDAVNGKFIPYVYMQRNIYVNPRNGDIEEGCGTYEDPYRIKDARQLLTLYLYLANKPEYQAVLRGTGKDDGSGAWKVVKVGGSTAAHNECSELAADSSLASTDHTADIVTYGSADFPTPDEMRTAYYKITADIDMSVIQDMNDLSIAGEFSGLGTAADPFAGVIIGTKPEGGNYKIILPKQATKVLVNADGSSTETQLTLSSFGLINYMSGAVVKDLDIENSGYALNKYYNITEYGGGVAARIVGGDNIIDNVNVKVNFNTRYDTIKGLGGYVGCIENGSIIFRNADKTLTRDSVSGCHYADFAAMSGSQLAASGIMQTLSDGMNKVLFSTGIRVNLRNYLNSSASYYGGTSYSGEYGEKVGLFVGRVYDGFAIYEGYTSADGSKPVILEKKDMGLDDVYSDAYPLINGFHMINGDVLSENTDGTSPDNNRRITVSFDNINKKYTVSLDSAHALEAFTLALNSDALSVFVCPGNDHKTGYGYKNNCRKAAYDNVGALYAYTSNDRIFAKTYDDNKTTDIGYLYPYVCYKYFDYTSGTDYLDATFEANNYAGYKNTLTAINITENNVARTCIVSNINATHEKVADYETTYILTKNSDSTARTFDLSPYDMSFRGIGGIYTYDYSDFRANFDGNGNIVKYYINRAFDSTILYSGMFNVLIYSRKLLGENISQEQYEIGNFTVKNSVVYNPNQFPAIGTGESSYLSSYGINTCATGGVVGMMKGAWRLHDITWERDQAITDGTIGDDVSGFCSVGGIVGRINNSISYNGYFDQNWLNANQNKMNDIDIINCNVLGVENHHFKVTELGSTRYATNWGGYRYVGVGAVVGTIGTNLFTAHTSLSYGDININACDLDYVNVLVKNQGYGGGFVGLIGTRHNNAVENTAQYASVGDITIDGKNSSDVISQVRNLYVDSYNASDAYSLGGIVGKLESPRSYNVVGGNTIISNYKLNNIDVDNTRTSQNGNNNNWEGTGGIIGYTRANLVKLEGIEFTGTNHIGNTVTQKNIGGLIGRMFNVSNTNNGYGPGYKQDNYLYIYNCNLSGMEVKSNNSSGGFVGYTLIEKINVGSETSSNTIKNSSVFSQSGSGAGGMFGYIHATDGNRFSSWPEVNFVNANVINTTVTANGASCASGGVVGLVYYATTVKTQLSFKNINVYSENSGTTGILATGNGGYAGAILGMTGQNNTSHACVTVHMDGYIGVGAKYDTGTDSWNNSVDGVNIRGSYAGGLIGRELTRNTETFPADIMVDGNRIYSMRTDNNAGVYSGGLYGEYYLVNGVNSTFNKVTVRNNLIYTGAVKNEYTAYNYNSGVGVACGSLMGYMLNEANTNVYLPYVTLENNSIGYYSKLFSDRFNTWDTVTLDSKDVKLFETISGKYKYVSWDEIAELNEANVAKYSVAFGQFIGKHSQTNVSGQVYIMNPAVTIDADKVGSIPVIDVGMNKYAAAPAEGSVSYQEGNPYLYRKYCHIVYFDDMTGTSNEDVSVESGSRRPKTIADELLDSIDKQYRFGTIKEQVQAYRNLNDGVDVLSQKNYNFITSKRLNMYIPYENTRYSLCGETDSYFNLTYDIVDEEGNNISTLNGVPVLVINGYLPQYVGDYAAAILTNGGGVVSEDSVIKILNGSNNVNANKSTMNKFWSIECENAYIDLEGNIQKIDNSDSRFAEHPTTSIECKYGNRLNLAESLYDQYIDVGNNQKIYTITLLKYKYTCPVATSDGTVVNNIKVIYIPVFVKEKVAVDSYIRILSGEEYSWNNASKIGYKDEVTVSHESIYTICAEFVYDGIRNNKAFIKDKLNKSITTKNNAGKASFTDGTKMTLIDYQTGIAYYYTVDNSINKNNIPFSAFKDKDGNNFEQRYISTGDNGIAGDLNKNSYTSVGYTENKVFHGGNSYTDKLNKKGIGIERFFIVVEPAVVENNIRFNLKITTEAIDENGNIVNEFFNKDKNGDKNGIDIMCIPGPMVTFGGVDKDTGEGTPGVTFAQGKISVDEEVKINSNIQIVLNDIGSPYWEQKIEGNAIDSANTDKYLEVAVTLMDGEGKTVQWPIGTNISFNGQSKTLLENNTVINLYRDDGKKQFAMNSLIREVEGTCYYYNVSEDPEVTNNMQWVYYDSDNDEYFYYKDYDPVESDWIKGYLIDGVPKKEFIDFSNQVDITLDFSAADIDDYSGKTFTVMMKLYRSDDPEFLNDETTKSLGKSVRQYTNGIFSESIKDLSVAVDVEDMMDLGINTYNSTVDYYDIPFANRFDFSGLINKNRKDEDIAEWASKTYTATYRLYKKVEDDGSGTGTLPDDYDKDIGNVLESADGTRYELISFDNSPFEMYDADDRLLSTKDITVNGSENQNVIELVKQFTESDIENGNNGTPFVTEWGMKLKVKREELDNTDLSNYKLTVRYETDDPGTDKKTYMDFFVFTIAKLKTDM